MPTKERATSKIVQKKLELRNALWPDLEEDRLWIRTKKSGFVTIPRTLPLFFKIMDSLSVGKPVSSTYMDIVCRAFDECYISLNRAEEHAFYSGFTGQRAVVTWKSRMNILSDLGFIDLRPGPCGPYSYALIWNPYLIVKELYEKKPSRVLQGDYNALFQRAIEIGADDFH